MKTRLSFGLILVILSAALCAVPCAQRARLGQGTNISKMYLGVPSGEDKTDVLIEMKDVDVRVVSVQPAKGVEAYDRFRLVAMYFIDPHTNRFAPDAAYMKGMTIKTGDKKVPKQEMAAALQNLSIAGLTSRKQLIVHHDASATLERILNIRNAEYLDVEYDVVLNKSNYLVIAFPSEITKILVAGGEGYTSLTIGHGAVMKLTGDSASTVIQKQKGVTASFMQTSLDLAAKTLTVELLDGEKKVEQQNKYQLVLEDGRLRRLVLLPDKTVEN